jgi:thiol-disulfide isomerase/thioredoxin
MMRVKYLFVLLFPLCLGIFFVTLRSRSNAAALRENDQAIVKDVEKAIETYLSKLKPDDAIFQRYGKFVGLVGDGYEKPPYMITWTTIRLERTARFEEASVHLLVAVQRGPAKMYVRMQPSALWMAANPDNNLVVQGSELVVIAHDSSLRSTTLEFSISHPNFYSDYASLATSRARDSELQGVVDALVASIENLDTALSYVAEDWDKSRRESEPVERFLMRSLKHPNPEIGLEAIRSLRPSPYGHRNSLPDAAMDQLLAVVADVGQSEELRQEAARTYTQLSATEPTKLYNKLWELGDGGHFAIPVLVDLMNSRGFGRGDKHDAPIGAAELLESWGPASSFAVPTLVAILTEHAAATLPRFAPESATFPTLVAMLTEHPQNRSNYHAAVARALLAIGPNANAIEEYLINRIETSDLQQSKPHMIPLLGYSNSPLSTSTLSRQLDHPFNLGMATEALLRQATPLALHELERRLTAQDYPFGGDLLDKILFHSNDPEKVKLLTLAQQSLNPQTRQAAENYMKLSWPPTALSVKHFEFIGKERIELSVEEWAVGPAVEIEQLKNSVVLLNFWALWFEPSWTTLQQLDAWQERYADDGLVVVSLSAYDGHGWDRQTASSYRLSERSKAEEFKSVTAFAEDRGIKHALGLVGSREQWRSAYAVEWLPQLVLIGRDGRIRMIRVGNLEEAPEVENQLAAALREMSFENRLVTQDALDALVHLPLHVLNLQRGKLDTDTVQLPSIDSLTTLHFDGMDLDNRSFASLLGEKDWPNIRTLTLSDTQIDDRALDRLAAFPALEVLSIGCNGITDQGVQALQQCAALKSLSLGDEWGHVPITAAGLMALAELTSLDTLELNGIQLSDDAAFAIEKIAGLRRLVMLGTGISMTSIERLRQSRPDVEMVFDRWTDWLLHEEFQRLFVELAQQDIIPLEIESELQEGAERYRGRFVPSPHKNFLFSATHGNSGQQFAMYESMAAAHSYERMSLSVLQTPAGEKKYSGTWVQKPYPAYWKTVVEGQTDKTRL